MQRIQKHLRNTFLAGIFAAIPVAVTVFIVVQVDQWTRGISSYLFGRPIPVVGVIIAAAAVYLTGLFVTISIGKFFLGRVDRLLERIPVIKTLYTAWKQVSLTPGGGEGMFARVVLVPDETGQMRTLGFTSDEAIPGDPASICVYVANSPNPIQGKLYFVARDKVRFTSLSSEEAFKLLLSTGNYVPAGIGSAAMPAAPAQAG
jgi:uncharacterized membrane protein